MADWGDEWDSAYPIIDLGETIVTEKPIGLGDFASVPRLELWLQRTLQEHNPSLKIKESVPSLHSTDGGTLLY